MNKDSRWIFYLLGRALTYALLGGIATALSGALCIGAAGTVTSWILRDPGGFVTLGGYIGFYLGRDAGALVGVLSFAVIGFISSPIRGILPSGHLILSAILGQVAGTISACFSFFGFMALFLRSKSGFAGAVDDHLLWIWGGAPALMMCAQTAATLLALSKQRSRSLRS